MVNYFQFSVVSIGFGVLIIYEAELNLELNYDCDCCNLRKWWAIQPQKMLLSFGSLNLKSVIWSLCVYCGLHLYLSLVQQQIFIFYCKHRAIAMATKDALISFKMLKFQISKTYQNWGRQFDRTAGSKVGTFCLQHDAKNTEHVIILRQ
jgi:hypothetical protein